jgi:membrane protein
MTVTYGILSAMPSVQAAGDQVQDLLFNNFLPESGQAIQGYLSDFARQARSLTAVGGLILVVTSVLMMSAIEKAFNQIWSIEESRKGVSSFLLYWSILTLGPVLIGAGFGFSSYVLSHKLFLSATDTLGITGFILQCLPIVTSSLAFMMLFWFVPNCKVNWKHALLGGFFYGAEFLICKVNFHSVYQPLSIVSGGLWGICCGSLVSIVDLY